MNSKQWDVLKKCASMEYTGAIPAGLIVDSPWIPGYIGMSTMDYLTIPDKWFDANLQVKKDFPEMILIPDFWIEFGMAAEPSGFGCLTSFYEHKTPSINHIITSADDIEQLLSLKQPNPKTDGLMPVILNLYKNIEKKVKGIDESIKIVAARGPLTIASYMMGLTEFLIALKIYPDETHKLLKMTTALTKNWLEAQAGALSEVEGVLVLDDVVGFLSDEDYKEFAHPYMKEIFHAFPDCIRMYHNDTDNPVCYGYLEELQVNIFNFTYKQEISKVRKLAGDKVCLLGNVPPLDVLAMGTPELVKERTIDCLKNYGRQTGIILSAGGGASPGTPKENIRAMLDTLRKFNKG
jgi:uroporphyrinogen-III decarboxylase